MAQVLHILRKDIRHFWPELFLCFSLFAAFIWIYPINWSHSDEFAAGSSFLDPHHREILANTVTALLPVGWLLLIARVVHAENLVGNRQFWITRPYRWQLLLVEKSLFFCLFICVPFFVAEAALLLRAGFAPTHYVAALLYNCFLITVVSVLPFFSLATILSSILRILGVLLAAFGIIAALAFLATSSPDSPSVSVPYTDRLSVPLIISLCVAVLLVQYSARRLWLARSLFLVFPLTIAVIAASPFERPLFDHFYPPPAPGALSLIRAGIPGDPETRWSASREDAQQIALSVPFQLIGIPPAHAAAVEDVRLTIDTQDGSHWRSPWEAIYNQRLLSGDAPGTLRVLIDRKFYAQVEALPVTVRVELAVTETAPGATTHFTYTPGGVITLPDGGLCDFEPAEGFRFSQFFCRVPFHHPQLVLLTTVQSPHPCSTSSENEEQARTVNAWTGSLDPDLSDIGLTPVWTDSISLPNSAARHTEDTPAQNLDLCPGALITLTQHHLLRRFRTEFLLSKAQLPTFPMAPSGDIFVQGVR